MGRLRKLFLFLIFSAPLSLQIATADISDSIQAGDLLFQSFPGHLCDAIQKETESPFCHVGIAKWEGEELVVVEALTKGVSKTPWEAWFNRTKSKQWKTAAAIGRWKTARDGSRLAQAAEAYLGTPYDLSFEWGKENLYCSELIYFAMEDAFGEEVLSPAPMTYDRLPDFWKKYFKGEVPTGKLGISPAAWATCQEIELTPIYP